MSWLPANYEDPDIHKHQPGPYSKTPLQVLVDIPEIQILSVRQVAKRRGAEISTFEASFFTGLDLVSPMIFGFHEDPEGHNDDHLDEVTDIVEIELAIPLQFTLICPFSGRVFETNLTIMLQMPSSYVGAWSVL